MSGRLTKPQRIMDVADRLLANITFTTVYERDYLAGLLNMKPDGMQFQLAMSDVNVVIERHGYHLTTAGSHGLKWSVVPLERSSRVVGSMNRQAMKLLYRSAVFAKSVLINHGDKISHEEKMRLEKKGEIAALRYVLNKRLR